jgi:hypothetical protein
MRERREREGLVRGPATSYTDLATEMQIPWALTQ